MSSILTVGRSILACLQPMTGTRATGTVLFTPVPAGPGLSVAPHTYMSPIVNAAYRADLPFKVPYNMSPTVTDGSWPLNASGSTAIPVMSNLGGSRYNLPAGTRFRLEPDAGDAFAGEVISNVDFAGGTDATKSPLQSVADLALCNAVLYETFGTIDSTEAFNSGMGGKFPAVLLTWLDDEPADGMATSNLSTGSKRGSLAMQYAQDFELWLVVDRSDNEALRRGQATRLLDEISYNIYDRMSVDELVFSSPGGLKIKRRSREAGNGEQFFKQFRVYTMLLSATITQEKKVFKNPAPLVRFHADYLKEDHIEEGSPGDVPMLHNILMPVVQDP
jgi:hypothetical protein